MVMYVELKTMLYVICYSNKISHTCTSDSKVSLRLSSRIFKMPRFGSSALIFQAGESTKKHLRMTKDVPRCQVSKCSFGCNQRELLLAGLVAGCLGCCHTGPETDGVPRSHGKARALPVASPVTRKKKSFAMETPLCIFHLCYL